ncbi:MAG: hypothetical protein R3E63_00850 [Pseudomonadales bacterium]
MKKELMVASVLIGVLAVVGCNKSNQQQTIELPAGQLHLGTQWVDGQLWVESFDPKTQTCLFSAYKNGKAVEGKTVTLNNCRTGLGGPMMRPSMERRMKMNPNAGGMMHPNMPQRPGRMHPHAMPQAPATGGQPEQPSVAPPAQD